MRDVVTVDGGPTGQGVDPAAAPIRVALVEDDDDLREEVVAALLDHDLDIRGYPDAGALYRGLLKFPCDVAILDIGLPGEDGFAILEYLRATVGKGIIMLSARSQTKDRLKALHDGADIYLVKPVDMDELAATIRSLARRLQTIPDPSAMIDDPVASWRLGATGWTLFTPDGQSVALSITERAALGLLLAQPNTSVTRDALVAELDWPPEDAVSNRLDMLFGRLRRKVQLSTGENLPVVAVRGAGFVFTLAAAGQ